MNGKNGTLVLFLPDPTYLVRAVGARAVLIPLILKCHVDRERMGGTHWMRAERYKAKSSWYSLSA